jgi:hypothetical protein
MREHRVSTASRLANPEKSPQVLSRVHEALTRHLGLCGRSCPSAS